MIDIKLNPSKRIYFCSDNHLGSPNRNLSLEREKIFITWLDQIKIDAQAIFFLGDLFDFWFEYKKVVPKGFTRLFGKLAELSDSGIDLFFFVGNHDCWIGNYFEDELGINVFHKKVDLNIDNYNILIGHGDGLGPGDNKYKFLKLLFRNPILKKLFSFIHPDIGISLGSFLSQKNKILSGSEKVFESEDKEMLFSYCKDVLKTKYYHFFIFGHRHIPLELDLGNNSKYFNTGDWITHFSYLVYDGNSFNLNYFNK
ncbi:MAG: UDP-2,3-diacylglucosamine diphosphatase [Flavobacteriaceae bacterium]|jgi:UDP-2,3-diacylglucosamine hydrolase|tara:strand:+ start:365 stop:1129 length:765 start_codon:yes stop_codon:yes gene_type:complete